MPDQRPTPPSRNDGRPAPLISSTSVVVVGLAAVLLFGIGLGGGLRWRYHRLMLQAQGAVLGLAVGFVAGRLSGSRH